MHGTCDYVFGSLHENGVGTAKKSAEIISEQNENQLWETDTLNVTTPQGLQKAMFIYVGKVCCLRSGEEQRNLKVSQFKCRHDHGGFFKLHVDNKEVSIFKNPTAGQQCLVSLLDMYFSMITGKAKETDTFYCRPLDKYRDDGPWYSVQPQGKHALNEMVKNMCNEARLNGNFTNHSL